MKSAPGTVPGDVPQVGHGSLAGWYGVVGKVITEIGQGEVEPLGQLMTADESLWMIGKESGHFRGAFQVSLPVGGEQLSGGIEMGVIADTGEDVVQPLICVSGIAHTVGGYQGQVEPSCHVDESLVTVLLGPQSVSLKLDVDAPLEKMRQVAELLLGRVGTCRFQNVRQQLSVSAGQAVEPGAVLFEILPTDPSFTFGSSSSRTGQQSAEVAIAGVVADE
jgi:hypothetical protein